MLLFGIPYLVFSFLSFLILCFFLNHTPTTEIYTLSLLDALPISSVEEAVLRTQDPENVCDLVGFVHVLLRTPRSEEHTSELQSHSDLVCRLLLEKKNKLIWTHSSACYH